MRISDCSSDVCSSDLLCQRLDLPDVVGRALASRQIGLDEAETYLSPTLRALMPAPAVLKDMDRAASRIAQAIRDGEARSEERRVGKECVSTCRSLWSPCNSKKK